MSKIAGLESIIGGFQILRVYLQAYIFDGFFNLCLGYFRCIQHKHVVSIDVQMFYIQSTKQNIKITMRDLQLALATVAISCGQPSR